MSVRLAVARRRARSDAGAGGVLALAVVGGALVVALAVLALAVALTARQRVVASADSAALAAADAVLGAIPGEPCDLATEVATAHDTALVECRLAGAHAYVTVEAPVAGVAVRVDAHAGPPP